MGKYSSAQTDIFNLLNQLKSDVRVFPNNFKGEKGDPPFVRVTIVPSGPPLNASSLSGVLLVEIFTAWGEGPDSSTNIADKLDKHLQYKSVGQTQLFNSSMDRQERDKDNQALSRTIYSLPFSHFGVN